MRIDGVVDMGKFIWVYYLACGVIPFWLVHAISLLISFIFILQIRYLMDSIASESNISSHFNQLYIELTNLMEPQMNIPEMFKWRIDRPPQKGFNQIKYGINLITNHLWRKNTSHQFELEFELISFSDDK